VTNGRTAKVPSAALPDLECACATIRRAARLVTLLYAQEIGPDLEPSQFALLFALSERPGASQTPLGRALGLDKTTLSRNLRLMMNNGWIKPAKSDDRRERGYALTPTGHALLARAKPRWERAQAKMRAAMGSSAWENMFRVMGDIVEAARKQAGAREV